MFICDLALRFGGPAATTPAVPENVLSFDGTLMDAFTVRDLRERTGDLIRDAEAGKLSVVTKHGRPVFVAVPFDEGLVREGLLVALAVRLFEEDVLSIGAAAKLAGIPVPDMLAELAARGVAAVRYPLDELHGEIETARGITRR